MAACWEFIIPKYAMDIPNVDAVNFPELVNKTIKENYLFVKHNDEFENISIKTFMVKWKEW